jgi:hypothetical protein
MADCSAAVLPRCLCSNLLRLLTEREGAHVASLTCYQAFAAAIVLKCPCSSCLCMCLRILRGSCCLPIAALYSCSGAGPVLPAVLSHL